MAPTFISPTGLINSVPRSKAGSRRASISTNNNNKNGKSVSPQPQPTSFSSHSTSRGSTVSSSKSGAQHQRSGAVGVMPNNNNNINHYGQRHGGGGGAMPYNGSSMLAAESFQKTYHNESVEPRVRRRSFEEAGHFMMTLNDAPSTSPIPSPPLLDATWTASETIIPPSPISPVHNTGSSNPFMCASIPALSALAAPKSTKSSSNSSSGNASVASAQSFTQRISQTSLACRQKYGPVASKAAGQAKAGMAEFAVLASEVYRQECRSSNTTSKSHENNRNSSNRGADADFFVQVQNEDSADNSLLMEDNSLLSSTEQRDSSNNENFSKTSARNKNSPEHYNNKRPEFVPTPSTVDSSSSASERLTPPPLVDRVLDTSRNMPPPFQNNKKDKNRSFGEGSNNSNNDESSLRNARIRLFENHVVGIDNPEARLARTLDDLNRQDIFIQSLKRQMQMTQSTLDDITEELTEVKTVAKEKQFKATEIRARAVQEKKRLEDLYQKEVIQSKKLLSTVSQLQTEVSTLKASLRNARSSSSSNNISRSSPTSAAQDSGRNAQIMSMKAELVELRSKLAEAHAVNIDGSSSRNTMGDIDELRKKMYRDESELKDLRQRNQEGYQERQDLMERERHLQEKLDSLQASSQETKSRLEENLEIAMKSADDIRGELVKTKANLQRMERERTRARLHSSADVERVQKDLAKSREECVVLKEELAKVRSMSKSERRELTKELEQLKQKLEKMNQENLANSAGTMREQRKLQDEVSCHLGEIRGLKERLMGKDEELAASSKMIAELEEDIQTLKKGFKGGTETVSRLSRDLEFSQNKHVASTVEATLYKSLLDEARSNPTDPQTQDFLNCINDDRIQTLKAHLEKFQASTPNCDSKSLEASLKQEIRALKNALVVSSPKPEAAAQNDERLLAMEQSFLNEISMLKAKLAESQRKIKEETFRSHEERRVNREGEIERQSEISRLLAEKNEAIEARHALQSEVAALRKLSSVASADIPDLVHANSSCSSTISKGDGMGVPSNVTRLRSELAQARERLAAARENSRSLPIRPTVSPGPNYEPSNWSNRSSKAIDASKPSIPTTVEEGQPCVPRSMGASTNKAADSLISKAETPRVSNGRSKNLSLEELTKQLEASRKRLQTADQRLNGLVSEGSLMTIVRKNPNDTSFDGSIDEVVNTAEGDIEVNHRRFADV